MSIDYKVGDGPCRDSEDWASMLMFHAISALEDPPPGSLAATLDSPERKAQRVWVGHSLIQAAHDGLCGCMEQHYEWLGEALTGVAPPAGFGK